MKAFLQRNFFLALLLLPIFYFIYTQYQQHKAWAYIDLYKIEKLEYDRKYPNQFCILCTANLDLAYSYGHKYPPILDAIVGIYADIYVDIAKIIKEQVRKRINLIFEIAHRQYICDNIHKHINKGTGKQYFFTFKNAFPSLQGLTDFESNSYVGFYPEYLKNDVLIFKKIEAAFQKVDSFKTLHKKWDTFYSGNGLYYDTTCLYVYTNLLYKYEGDENKYNAQPCVFLIDYLVENATKFPAFLVENYHTYEAIDKWLTTKFPRAEISNIYRGADFSAYHNSDTTKSLARGYRYPFSFEKMNTCIYFDKDSLKLWLSEYAERK
jgi:hypothetical protein